MLTADFDWTAQVHALVAAFEQELGLAATRSRPFGGRRQGLRGASDDAQGVQWHAWLHVTGEAWCAVNLEGLAYKGWPIARLIERELAHGRLLDARDQVATPEAVEVLWSRDAWQVVSRPPIDEKHIGGGPVPLAEITPDRWAALLREAYACLDAGRHHRARARQLVTLSKRQLKAEKEVSPHLQLRQRLELPEGDAGWADTLRAARQNLLPLHAWAVEQSQV